MNKDLLIKVSSRITSVLFTLLILLGALGYIQVLPAVTTVWLILVGITGVLGSIFMTLGLFLPEDKLAESCRENPDKTDEIFKRHTPLYVLYLLFTTVLTSVTLLYTNSPILFIFYVYTFTAYFAFIKRLRRILGKDDT